MRALLNASAAATLPIAGPQPSAHSRACWHPKASYTPAVMKTGRVCLCALLAATSCGPGSVATNGGGGAVPPVTSTLIGSAPTLPPQASSHAAAAKVPAYDATKGSFAALFRPEEKGVFRYLDDVDPHDVSGERLEHMELVRCRTLEPSTIDAATRGALACSAEELEFEVSFMANQAGLFWQHEASVPSIASNALLSRVPYSTTFDAGDDGASIPCTRVGEPLGNHGYCTVTRCKVTIGYGDTLERLCVDEQGLVEYESENIEGPRHRRLARVGSTREKAGSP